MTRASSCQRCARHNAVGKIRIIRCDGVDDPVQCGPDITKDRGLLNWEPRVALETGLKHTIEYFDRLLTERGEKPATGAKRVA